MASGITISDGARLAQSAGGSLDALSRVGGTLQLASGAVSSGVVLGQGQTLALVGDEASFTTVSSSGKAFVFAGAQISGLVLNSGGVIDLQTLTFSSGGSVAFDGLTGARTVVQGGEQPPRSGSPAAMQANTSAPTPTATAAR